MGLHAFHQLCGPCLLNLSLSAAHIHPYMAYLLQLRLAPPIYDVVSYKAWFHLPTHVCQCMTCLLLLNDFSEISGVLDDPAAPPARNHKREKSRTLVWSTTVASIAYLCKDAACVSSPVAPSNGGSTVHGARHTRYNDAPPPFHQAKNGIDCTLPVLQFISIVTSLDNCCRMRMTTMALGARSVDTST